jgi:hypothetical protein
VIRTARRLVAAALVAAGVAILTSPRLGLIAAGVGLAWSRVELPAVVGVNRLLMAARRRGDSPQHTLPVDPPAPTAEAYDQGA